MRVFSDKFTEIEVEWVDLVRWFNAAHQELMNKLDRTHVNLWYSYRTRNPNRYFKNNFGFELRHTFGQSCIRVYDPKKMFVFQMKHGLILGN